MEKSKDCKVPNKSAKPTHKRTPRPKTQEEQLERLSERANDSSLRFVTVLTDSLLALPHATKAQRERMEKRLYKSFVIAQVDACKASHLAFINQLTSK